MTIKKAGLLLPLWVYIVTSSIVDSTFAGTLIVPTQFASIQTAIDSAAAGDTVYILNGTFGGDIKYKSRITIIGQDNRNTIIDGGGILWGFHGGGLGNDRVQDVHIENLRITNCITAIQYDDNARNHDPSLFSIVIRNNVMDNIGTVSIFLHWNSGKSPALVEKNTFINCGDGIYMSRADSSVVVSNNYIDGCGVGIGVYTDSRAVIRNNVVTRSRRIGIEVFGGGNPTIINNTVLRSGGAGIKSTHDATAIRNNIICFNGTGVYGYAADPSLVDYNDVYGNSRNYNFPPRVHDISCDPLFTDTLSYHLSAGSPCIDAGDPLSHFGNEPAYNGRRINLGAYGNTAEATSSHPEIALSAGELLFEAMEIPETDTIRVWIRNDGMTRLNIDSMFLWANVHFVLHASGHRSILPGDSLETEIVYSPTIPGFDTSAIAIFCNDEDEPRLTVGISGVCYSRRPIIKSIEDVPNDQGGWVKLAFYSSVYDTDSLILKKALFPEMYSIESDDGSGWISLASLVAYGVRQYAAIVHTTRDSTASNPGLIKFRVIAGMDEGNFASIHRWGYSLDNLAPLPPTGLTASLSSSSEVCLGWLPSQEEDLQYYTVYRRNDEDGFSCLAKTSDTLFIDDHVLAAENYEYSVSATDHSGNEGRLSQGVVIRVSDVDDHSGAPANYDLSQNYPNPFNPLTTIRYGLPNREHVTLAVFNTLGQQVSVLQSGEQDAGYHEVRFDGSNLPSGVYFYRMQAGNYTETKKLLLLK